MSKAEETTTVQWFKNGDHPQDYAEDREGFENGELVTFSAALCKAKEWEGGVVRYFRSPSINGDSECASCGSTAHEHGWLDDGGNGQAVCPGDFIVTTDGRHVVVQQPARAEAQAKAQQAQDRKDAERYRLQSQIDACRPYLKEGETVADALNRMQKEVTTLRNAAMQLWADRSTFDKEDAARYRLLRIGQQWSVIDGIGDTLRAEVLDAAIDKALAAQEVAG